MSNSRLLTGKVKKVYGDRLTVDRYNNLSLSQAEPDLGLPPVNGSILIGSTSSNVRTWSNMVTVSTAGVVTIFSTASDRFSYNTNALRIQGGAVVGGNLHVGGTAYLNGAEILTTSSGLSSVLGDSVINQILKVNTTTNATSTTTGALQVQGGVGIGGALFVGGLRNTGTSLVVYYNTTTGELSYNEVAGGGVGGGDVSPFAGIFTITNTTAANSTITGALQVAGGVGIQGNLYVGGTAYLNNAEVLTTSSRITSVEGLTQVTQDFVVNTTTNATSTNTGALQVIGGVGIGLDVNIGGKVRIESTLSSTTTVANNALYVAGGVGIGKSLLVTGEAVFLNNVVFAGTSTYIYSTNTVYTDNLINLHVPTGSGGSNHSWTVDDGKDIGFIYHYYKSGQDKDAFLGLSNTTGYLEWYATGDEYGGVFTGTSYGTFKTGSIVLANATSATSTTTGALTVAGGVGIVGDLHVGGSLYQNGQQVGVRGYTGSQGDTGFTGSRGFSGFVGSVGFTGSGGTGFTGSRGDIGYTGSQGPAGSAGTGGTAGETGFTGSIGYTGSKGDMGFTGPIGYTGSGGYTGSEGRFGYTGSKGERGDAGSGGASTILERHYRKPGVLTVNTGTEKWYVPVSSTITSIRARVESAPAGNTPLNLVVNVNNVSTATLSINSSTTISSLNTATVILNVNDYVTVDVVNIGNNVPGTDLTVTFTFIRNL